MSSLRRDLVERKLWMLVALLVVGVAAVPVLLLKGASASGTALPPAPPAAAPATSQTTTAVQPSETEPVKVVLARIARDPFASGVPKLSSKPASASPSSSSSASPATTTTAQASASSAAPVSMVSPSPATTTASSPASSSDSSTSASTATTPASSAPTSTIASVSPTSQGDRSATPQSWTVYSVSVRYGKNTSVPAKSDIARLTPLPSIMAPEVMFMGVMSDGKSAVFALHSGLGHTGPGLCRPDHEHCSAIVLKAGQTEHISIPSATGPAQQVVLRVVKISSTVTHSRTNALAAYRRVNPAGQCELALANPVSYDPVSGTISSVAKSACQNHPNAVPFAYLVTAP